MLVKMTIDEERNMVIQTFSMKNGEKKITESYHNLMWCEFKLQWSTFIKKDRMVAFKFKDFESQEAFKAYNDDNEKMLNCVEDCTYIVSGGRKWFSELKDSIHKYFKRIQIRSQEKDEFLQKC